MVTFLLDLRHTVRKLSSSLGFGFKMTFVLRLALGVGANGVVDAVPLRPLPYPESMRLVAI